MRSRYYRKRRYYQNKSYLPLRGGGTIFPQKLKCVLRSSRILNGAPTLTTLDPASGYYFDPMTASPPILNSIANPFNNSSITLPQWYEVLANVYQKYYVWRTDWRYTAKNNGVNAELCVYPYNDSSSATTPGLFSDYAMFPYAQKRAIAASATGSISRATMKGTAYIRQFYPLAAPYNMFSTISSSPAELVYLGAVVSVTTGTSVSMGLEITLYQHVVLARSAYYNTTVV